MCESNFTVEGRLDKGPLLGTLFRLCHLSYSRRHGLRQLGFGRVDIWHQ